MGHGYTRIGWHGIAEQQQCRKFYIRTVEHQQTEGTVDDINSQHEG